MIMNQVRTIKIKKGTTTFEVNRSDLISCDETPDGVVFQFKNGIMFQYNDPNIPSGVKNLIKNTVDRMVNGNIEINLDNLANPILFSAI